MDIKYLEKLMDDRDELSTKSPSLIGRHSFYYEQQRKIIEGLQLIDKNIIDNNINDNDVRVRLRELGATFVQVRKDEAASHFRRFQTVEGNKIHTLEEELYSMALDVFYTYGSDAFKKEGGD